LILFKTTFFKRSKVALAIFSPVIGVGELPELIKNGGTTMAPKLAFPRNEMNDRLLYFI
jgi:hypothetical protein